MPLKKRSHNIDTAIAKPRVAQPVAQSLETASQQIDLGAVLRRATIDRVPPSRQDILQLQRAVGNQKVMRLVGSTAQHQSIHRGQNSVGIPGTPNAAAEGARAPIGSGQREGALLQPAPDTKGQSANTIQRISDFSAWFIKKILIPILLEIMGEEQNLPSGFVLALAQLERFLEVDDSEDEDWAVAIGALQFFISKIGSNEPRTIELVSMIVGQLEKQLQLALGEAHFEKENYTVLLDYLNRLRARLMRARHVDRDREEDDDEGSSEEEIPEELGELFETYPQITNPLRRRGHLNPYRHGIGAADTIAIVSVNRRQLIARAVGNDPKKIAKIEAKFKQLDQQIKAINDQQEKPILQKIVALLQQKNQQLDSSSKGEVDTSVIDEKIKTLRAELQVIREGDKKLYREKLRKLYEKIFWISQKNQDDDTQEAREARLRQLREFFELEGDEDFAISYTRADESGEDYFNKAQKDNPIQTAHHSEQRVIVNKHWLTIRQTVCDAIREAMKGSKSLKAIKTALKPIVITMSINRSSCYMCNAFLVSELISLWKEIAKLLEYEGDWRDIRNALRDIFIFEVTYSIPYSKVKDVEELDGQLKLAGWHVSQHEETEKSDDEGVHESLSTNKSAGSSEDKEKKKGKSRSNKQEDSDFELEGEEYDDEEYDDEEYDSE